MPNEVQLIHANHAGVAFAVVGSEVRASVDAGTLGLGDAAYASIGTTPGDVAAADDARFGSGALPLVAGAAGFVTVSGAVTLDLSLGWTHHLTVTGNVTSLGFSNIPTATVTSAIVRLVIRQDATGGHTVAEPAGLVFKDGRSWSDLAITPAAVNSLWLERVGADWHAYLDNGILELEDFYLDFQASATIKVVIRRPQVIDATGANVEVDGAGTVTIERTPSGGAKATITAATAFGTGDVLHVTASAGQSVTIPRYL
jgi:hypothetical protein